MRISMVPARRQDILRLSAKELRKRGVARHPVAADAETFQSGAIDSLQPPAPERRGTDALAQACFDDFIDWTKLVGGFDHESLQCLVLGPVHTRLPSDRAAVRLPRTISGLRPRASGPIVRGELAAVADQ